MMTWIPLGLDEAALKVERGRPAASREARRFRVLVGATGLLVLTVIGDHATFDEHFSVRVAARPSPTGSGSR